MTIEEVAVNLNYYASRSSVERLKGGEWAWRVFVPDALGDKFLQSSGIEPSAKMAEEKALGLLEEIRLAMMQQFGYAPQEIAADEIE